MTEVILETSRIYDWDSFHTVCAESFGFPDFYGRNMNAWIDCLRYLDDGMTKFNLAPEEKLLIVVPGFLELCGRVPEIVQGFLECVAFVNHGQAENGLLPRLLLSLQG